MPQYMVAKGSNPAYMLFFQCQTANLEVICDLPETTVMALQSEWEQRMSGGLFSSVLGGAVTVTGVSPSSQEWNTRQTWASTSPIELSFTLQFDAQNSAYNDVFQPMMAVMQLVAPENIGDILLPPGPSRVDKSRNAVVLGVGKMFTISDGILVSAQGTFDTRMSAEGFPIAGELEITVRTSVVYSRNDMKKLVGTP